MYDYIMFKLFKKMEVNIGKAAKRRKHSCLWKVWIYLREGGNQEKCLLISFEKLNCIMVTLIKVNKNKSIQTFFLI